MRYAYNGRRPYLRETQETKAQAVNQLSIGELKTLIKVAIREIMTELAIEKLNEIRQQRQVESLVNAIGYGRTFPSV